MTYTLGVVAFVVALLASVMLHEFGHFATAKHYGMKATKFFVGFGPTLWSTQRGETEYGVKAIPAGGFVKIIGMTPLEEVEPGDEDRVFFKQPPGRRFVVLVAGSATHLIIAFLLLFGVIAVVGDPVHSVTTLTVDSTTPCVLSDTSTAQCTAADPASPAVGKLRSGDKITAIDGKKLSSYQALRSTLQASPGRPVTLTIVRDGQARTITLTPVAVQQDGRTVGKIGFYPVTAPAPVSVAGAVPKTFTTLGTFFTSTVKALGDLPHQVSQILKGQPRGNGAASVVDIARVSGQVAQSHVSIGDRVATLLLIVAQVNFFIGIFNLLPLLPLDGGHIAILGYEEGRSRLYRRLGRPDPGRVDLLKIMPVTYAVVALFIGLSLLLVYAGIVNPIRIQ
jgi:membrane-associated protease RseP (regulator of RpoE activity)